MSALLLTTLVHDDPAKHTCPHTAYTYVDDLIIGTSAMVLGSILLRFHCIMIVILDYALDMFTKRMTWLHLKSSSRIPQSMRKSNRCRV